MRTNLTSFILVASFGLFAVGCGAGPKPVAASNGNANTTTNAKSNSAASTVAVGNTSQSPMVCKTNSMAMSSTGSNGKMMDQPPVIKGVVKDGVYVSAVDGKPLCPVDDDEIADVKGAEHTKYHGVTYYFCCNSCPVQFKAHPNLYAVKSSSNPK